MVQKHTDIRCKQCNSLLAREDRDGLCVRRGDMQLIVSGAQFAVSVTCYRCRTLNVVDRRAA
jgi:phage FluMu protein Com